MKETDFITLPFMPDLETVAEQNNNALKQVFEGKIKGYFLIDIKDRVMRELGWKNIVSYYDFSWSNERMVTGIGGAAEYDVCRMILGIHKAHSIFLSESEIRKNEKSRRYKQQLVSETIEKIKLRPYGSVHFRPRPLLDGEEFLYYPLPYELFAMSVIMSERLNGNINIKCWQLYYGIIYNGLSAFSLLEDNLLGSAYPLCRGAIELYIKLLILNIHSEICEWYEEFREFEIKQSCVQTYSEEFKALFAKRICQKSKSKGAYLHFGWVDHIDGYHDTVKSAPYSVYGVISYLKEKNKDKILELERLERFYKACHAYTHGSIQIAKYPILHYFEISIMLYYVVRGTFLMLCKDAGGKDVIRENDIISMADKEFELLYKQYEERSTEKFEAYYSVK